MTPKNFWLEKRRWKEINKVFIDLLIVTLITCVPAFVLYSVARVNGSLPSEAEWSTHGGNHGPWWDDWRGVVITFACMIMIVLPFVTILSGLFLCFKNKIQMLLLFTQSLVLAALQFALSYALLLIFWVAD